MGGKGVIAIDAGLICLHSPTLLLYCVEDSHSVP